MLKKTTLFTIFLLLVLPHLCGAESLVDRLMEKYSDILTLKADFVQHTYYHDFDREKDFKGRLLLKRPDRMLLQYTSNSSDMLYVNRNRIILYQPKYRQAFYTTVEKTGLSRSPLLFLFSLENLKEEFRTAEDKKTRCITLTPLKNSSISLITLCLDRAYLIERLVIVDSAGNKSDIRLHYLGLNQPIEDSLFSFIPPEGTTIIRQ